MLYRRFGSCAVLMIFWGNSAFFKECNFSLRYLFDGLRINKMAIRNLSVTFSVTSMIATLSSLLVTGNTLFIYIYIYINNSSNRV